MTAGQNLLVLGILLALFLIFYCKATNQTLKDLWHGLVEMIEGKKEEVTG